jgi:hypothetical protein
MAILELQIITNLDWPDLLQNLLVRIFQSLYHIVPIQMQTVPLLINIYLPH